MAVDPKSVDVLLKLQQVSSGHWLHRNSGAVCSVLSRVAVDTGITPLFFRRLCVPEDFCFADTCIGIILPAGQVALASVFPA